MSRRKPQSEEEWLELFNEFYNGSRNTGEAIKKVQDFIKENYSFSLPENATAYVYFGSVDGKGNICVWQVIDDLTEKSGGQRGYISSTEAGKLFLNPDFNTALKLVFKDDVDLSGIAIADEDRSKTQEDTLYEGKEHSGRIHFDDKSTAQAFNDFFSQNYIENLRCANVHAIVAGAPLARGGKGYNCFIRTELDSILKNEHIRSINGIKKELFLKPDRESSYEAKKLIADLLKATQVNECSRLHFTVEETEKDGRKKTDVHVTYFELPEDTSGIAFDFASTNVMSVTMARNGMIGDFSASHRYMIAMEYPEKDAYLLDKKLKTGALEYSMLAKEGSEQVLVMYDFDPDKMLLDKLTKQRAERVAARQSESAAKVAPIDVQARVDMTHSPKQASTEGFDISRTKREHPDRSTDSSGVPHEHKKRSSKLQTGPTM